MLGHSEREGCEAIRWAYRLCPLWCSQCCQQGYLAYRWTTCLSSFLYFFLFSVIFMIEDSPTARHTAANPLYTCDKSVLGSFTCVDNFYNGTFSFISHPKNEASVKCLATMYRTQVSWPRSEPTLFWSDNNIISKSYIGHVIYQTRYSRRWVYTNFQKDMLLQWWVLRPNYLAPSKGLQGATAHTAATARKTRVNPFSFLWVHWIPLHGLLNTWDPRLYVPSEGQSNGQVSCLRTQVSRLGIRTHTLVIRNTRVWIWCS